MAARYFGADYLLAAVAAEHQAFYVRAFNHQLICEPRPYPLLAKPIGLTALHCPTEAPKLYRRYPFLRSTFFERRMLFERPMAGSLQPGARGEAEEDQPFAELVAVRPAE